MDDAQTPAGRVKPVAGDFHGVHKLRSECTRADSPKTAGGSVALDGGKGVEI